MASMGMGLRILIRLVPPLKLLGQIRSEFLSSFLELVFEFHLGIPGLLGLLLPSIRINLCRRTLIEDERLV